MSYFSVVEVRAWSRARKTERQQVEWFFSFILMPDAMLDIQRIGQIGFKLLFNRIAKVVFWHDEGQQSEQRRPTD